MVQRENLLKLLPQRRPLRQHQPRPQAKLVPPRSTPTSHLLHLRDPNNPNHQHAMPAWVLHAVLEILHKCAIE